MYAPCRWFLVYILGSSGCGRNRLINIGRLNKVMIVSKCSNKFPSNRVLRSVCTRERVSDVRREFEHRALKLRGSLN